VPNFPRYQSKAVPSTQLPSVGAVESTEGKILEQTAKVAQGVQDTSLKWINAVDTIQKTTATANFKSGMLDVLQRAEADPNYNNSDQYLKEIEKLRTDNLKGFASKTAETETALNLGLESKFGAIQIKNLYDKKMIDVGQASTLRLLDLETKNPSPDMEKRISAILGEQVQAGVIGHKDAYELQKKYVKEGKYNSFLSDLNTSPSRAESKLSKNEYGFDVRELESAKGIYEKELNKIQATTQNELLTSYINGEEIDSQTLRNLMNEKKIDATFAEGLINKIENPKPDTFSKDTAFIEFQNKMMDLQEKGDKASIGELAGFMSEVMKAHSQGLLDKADVERILKDRNEIIQKKLEGTAEDVMGKVQPKTLFERISFWSDEYADKKPEIKARMYRKLIDGMSQGKDGATVLRKVMDDEIELQMSNNLKAPDRQYAVNPETKKRIYSEDGGATWFDESGKEIK